MNSTVALIYPYFLTDAEVHMLYQPLGIASLAMNVNPSFFSTAWTTRLFSAGVRANFASAKV